MRNSRTLWIALILLSIPTAALVAADNSWLSKVPSTDRQRVNPYAGQPEAIAAGNVLFEENCAKCHGSDAEGRHRRPSLRSERVARATDGELAWLLRNGSLRKGMPTWSSLPEPERWQLIAFLRSLPRDGPPAATVSHP
jgi:mono/diheme cytochrome c family protein